MTSMRNRCNGGWLAMLCALSMPAHASSSLSFEGGGYWIDIEVGDADVPAVAGVRVHRADDAEGVRLPRASWTVDRFDVEHRRLELRYRGGDGIAPFELYVEQQRAVLQIDAQRIVVPFDWGM